MIPLIPLVLLLQACPLVTQAEWDAANDRDGDGFPTTTNGGTDCDDQDASVHPGADEICDGLDNNCDGRIDEGHDQDGDGFRSCDGDCDDDDASVNPDAQEICDDGVDNDCDGTSNGCAIVGEQWLEQASARFTGIGGSAYADWAGKGLAGGGDVNGDGYDDLLIGAPYRDSRTADQAGAAYILLGPVTADRSLSLADATFEGLMDYDLAGWDIAMVGDTDKDGLDDVLVSAPYADKGWAASGSVYLFLGRNGQSGQSTLPDSQASITGDGTENYLGYDVDGGGDVNGDGYTDIILGAHGAGDTGLSYLFLGPVSGTLIAGASADAVLYGSQTQDYAGKGVSTLQDVNGDGWSELLIGAPNAYAEGQRPGRAYLLQGPVSGQVNLDDADAILTGETDGDHAGEVVDSGGDYNGDGYTDLLISAPTASRPAGQVGVIYLVLGPASGSSSLAEAASQIEGETSGDWTGWSVAGLGDVDGDELGDLLVGVPEHDSVSNNDGAAYLVYGPQSGTLLLPDASAVFVGESAADYAGGRVAAAGDVDADGHRDLLIGAYGYENGAGAAYLQYGSGL